MLAQQVSTGELANLWRVGTSRVKISRKVVDSTDLVQLVRLILAKYHPISLRVASILLLGAVRIYDKKCEFLATDSAGTLTNIQKTEIEKSKQQRKSRTTAREDRITMQTKQGVIDVGWEDVEREIIDALGEAANESAPNPGSTPAGADMRLELETQFAGIESLLSQSMFEVDFEDEDMTTNVNVNMNMNVNRDMDGQSDTDVAGSGMMMTDMRGDDNIDLDFNDEMITPNMDALNSSVERFRHDSMSAGALEASDSLLKSGFLGDSARSGLFPNTSPFRGSSVLGLNTTTLSPLTISRVPGQKRERNERC